MFQDISILPIIIAVIADMVVSTIWYSPFLFGNYWMSEIGFKKEDVKGPGKAMGFAVLASLVMATVLSILLDKLNITTVDGAIETAFMVWLGFVATTNSLRVVYEKVKPSVYFLQVTSHLVGLILMAIILVSWA